jgi:sulfide:quinone oxidoreductase
MTAKESTMKRLLILGGGTAGTMVANKLRPRLHADDWSITVVDQDDVHLYQPGYLFIPFGIYEPDDVVKPREQFIPEGVELVIGAVDEVVPDDNSVLLTDGRTLDYDQLVIASGTTPRPDQTPGMDGEEFGKSIHEFYSLAGSTALAHTLKTWEGGRLVVHIVDMPIKCPVAPLEFTFLADAFFAEHGMRDQVEITYVTPLPGAFTKPIASKYLGGMLDERKIALESDFMVERIDEETKTLVSYDEREVPFDLLVTIPLNMGADFVARSGLGDELNYVPVDKGTLLSTGTTTSGRSATPRTSPRPRLARWPTSRSRSSPRTSCATSTACRCWRSSTATPTVSWSPGTARPCSSTSTTTPSLSPAGTRCPASARSAC